MTCESIKERLSKIDSEMNKIEIKQIEAENEIVNAKQLLANRAIIDSSIEEYIADPIHNVNIFRTAMEKAKGLVYTDTELTPIINNYLNPTEGKDYTKFKGMLIDATKETIEWIKQYESLDKTSQSILKVSAPNKLVEALAFSAIADSNIEFEYNKVYTKSDGEVKTDRMTASGKTKMDPQGASIADEELNNGQLAEVSTSIMYGIHNYAKGGILKFLRASGDDAKAAIKFQTMKNKMARGISRLANRNTIKPAVIYAVQQKSGDREDNLEAKDYDKAEYGYIADGDKVSLYVENNKVGIKITHKDGKTTNIDQDTMEVSPLALLLGVEIKEIAGTKHITVNTDKFDMLENSIAKESLSSIANLYEVLNVTDEKEFDQIWGLNSLEFDPENPDQKSMLRDQIKKDQIANRLIPRSVVINKLGSAIYANLPVKYGSNIDKSIADATKTQLGLIGIAYLEETLVLENINKRTLSSTDKDGNITRVKIKDTVTIGNVTQTLLSVREHGDLTNDLMQFGSQLEYIAPGQDKFTISLDKIPVERDMRVRNSNEQVSDNQLEYMQKMQDVPWKFNEFAKRLRDIYKINKDMAYKMANIYEPDLTNNLADIESEVAKLEADRMMFDLAMDRIDQFEDERFYIKYDFTVSGRNMMDVDITPQGNKIVRSLMYAPDMESNIEFKDGKMSEEELYMLKVAMAQALDTGIDKKLDKNAISKLDTIVNIKADGTIEYGTDELALALKQFVEIMTQLDKAKDLSVSTNGIVNDVVSNETKAKLLETIAAKGEGFHAVQAAYTLYELTKFKSKEPEGDVFSHTMFAEADAITSGMILTLLEIGSPLALEIAEKGGIYTPKAIEKWTKIAEAFGLKDPTDTEFKISHGLLKEIGAKATAINTINKSVEYKSELNAFKDELIDEYNSSDNDMIRSSISNEIDKVDAELESIDVKVEEAKNKNKINDTNKAEFEKNLADAGYTINDAMFLDIYETVAHDANEQAQKERVSLLKDIKAFKAELKRIKKSKDKAVRDTYNEKYRELLSMQKKMSLLNKLSEITRSLAKSPVMVFIYGSSIKSIKKKLLNTIMKPIMYDVLKKYTIDGNSNPTMAEFVLELNRKKIAFETLTDDEVLIKEMFSKSNVIKNVETSPGSKKYEYEINPTVYLQKVQHKAYNSKTKRLEQDNNMRLNTLYITDQAIKGLDKLSSSTVGEMFEKGFKKFELVDEYRDIIKSVELVRYTTFKYKYKQYMNELMTKKMNGKDGEYVFTKRDMDQVIRRLQDEGFAHNTPDINGGKQSLQKTEKDKSSKELDRTVFAYRMTKSGNFITTTGSIPITEFVPNTGASGVITIHSKDGYIEMLATSNYQALNIYDAIATRPGQINDTTTDYNSAVNDSIAFGTLYEQLNDINGRLEKLAEENPKYMQEMLDSIDKREADHILNSLENLMDMRAEEMRFTADAMKQNSDKIVKDREENLSEKELTIAHSYLSDSAKTFNGITPKILAENVEEKSTNVFNALKDIVENIRTKATKQMIDMEPGVEADVQTNTDETVDKLNSIADQFSSKPAKDMFKDMDKGTANKIEAIMTNTNKNGDIC